MSFSKIISSNKTKYPKKKITSDHTNRTNNKEQCTVSAPDMVNLNLHNVHESVQHNQLKIHGKKHSTN